MCLLVLNGAESGHTSQTLEDVLNARDMDTSAQFALEQRSVQTVALLEHTHSRDNPCNLKSSCTNCGQEHPAFSKRCPRWLQEKEIITLKTTKDISFPQARRLVEQTTGPLTYAKVAGYPTPTLRDSPRRKIQLDGMKAISKTTPTTSDKNSRQIHIVCNNPLHDSCSSPSSQLTKTTAILTKTTQSVFSTPVQSDNRPEDSDNMATDDATLVDIEDKNQQDSSEMTSDEEVSESDEDCYSKMYSYACSKAIQELNKDFRKEMLEN